MGLCKRINSSLILFLKCSRTGTHQTPAHATGPTLSATSQAWLRRSLFSPCHSCSPSPPASVMPSPPSPPSLSPMPTSPAPSPRPFLLLPSHPPRPQLQLPPSLIHICWSPLFLTPTSSLAPSRWRLAAPLHFRTSFSSTTASPGPSQTPSATSPAWSLSTPAATATSPIPFHSPLRCVNLSVLGLVDTKISGPIPASLGQDDEDISSDQSPGQSSQSLDVPVPATQSQPTASWKPTPGSPRRSKRLQNKRA